MEKFTLFRSCSGADRILLHVKSIKLSMNTITVRDLTFSYFYERYSLTVSICLSIRQLKQLAEKRTLLDDNQ